MTSENLITAPVGTTHEQARQILAKHRIEKLPLVDEEGHLRGLITIKDIQKAQKYPNSAKDASGRLLCGAAVGVSHDVFDRIAGADRGGRGYHLHRHGARPQRRRAPPDREDSRDVPERSACRGQRGDGRRDACAV